MRLLLCVGFVTFSLGCGGSPAGADGGTGGGSAGGSAGANSVTGSVNGRSMTIVSAAAQRYQTMNSLLVLRLSEHTATCNMSSPVGVAASDKRMVTVTVDLGDAGVPAPGQFKGTVAVQVPDCSSSMTGSNGVVNPLTQLDASQNASITVLEAGSRVRGTFTTTLSSGAPFSGAFDTEFCNFLGSGYFSQAKCN